jgi:hypothetical protein
MQCPGTRAEGGDDQGPKAAQGPAQLQHQVCLRSQLPRLLLLLLLGLVFEILLLLQLQMLSWLWLLLKWNVLMP